MKIQTGAYVRTTWRIKC